MTDEIRSENGTSPIVLPELPIVFDEATHSYINIYGHSMPSVTYIMRFMSRELYGPIPEYTLNEAASRGTRVHKLTEDMDRYGWAENDDDTSGYLDAYLKFLRDFQPTWLGSEWRGYHRTLLYAGTLDRIGYATPDTDEGVDVVDIKTTRTFHQVMIGTQVDAYAEILMSYDIKVRNRYGLQLLSDGSYVFRKVPRHFKTFLHCLSLHNAMSEEVRP